MEAPARITEIKAAIAATLAALTAFWGWVGWTVAIFSACMFMDYVTGSWAARSRGEWSSTIARQGLWHKLGEIVALLVAALCDIAMLVIIRSEAAPLLNGLDHRCYLTLLVSIWYIFTELGSIIENAIRCGAPCPNWLKDKIKNAKDKLDEQQSGHPPDTGWEIEHSATEDEE